MILCTSAHTYLLLHFAEINSSSLYYCTYGNPCRGTKCLSFESLVYLVRDSSSCTRELNIHLMCVYFLGHGGRGTHISMYMPCIDTQQRKENIRWDAATATAAVCCEQEQKKWN